MMDPKNTPLMQQYFDIKKDFSDTLLFFQVGDFYELFFEDAKQASSYLALTLTKRGKNKGEDIPLCGVPVHAVNHYLKKLISGGFKVALCQQLTKPQPGAVVQRGVTHVFTPGTLTDTSMLDEKSASYLLSFFPTPDDGWGLLFTELLTAQLFATTVPSGAYKMMEAELVRFLPDEIVLAHTPLAEPFTRYFNQQGFCTTQTNKSAEKNRDIHAQWIQSNFPQETQSRLAIETPVLQALKTLYDYLERNQTQALEQFSNIHFYEPDDYLILDASTQRNLDIVCNNNDGSRKNSLFAVLDKAKTGMGSRAIKKWLLRPLLNKNTIIQRQEVIHELCSSVPIMQQLEHLLSQLSDLERIIGRIALKRASLEDYKALADSLKLMPAIKDLLTTGLLAPLAKALASKLYSYEPLVELLASALNDDPAHDGPIKKGFDLELDRLSNLVDNAQQALLQLEQQEIERTGISSLKIRYNQISGYYIEVTNANLSAIPADYVHQQTLVNRRRFTTKSLQDLERDIVRAQNEIAEVEEQVFQGIKNDVATYLAPVRQTAYALSCLDALYGLSQVAYHNRYSRPTFNDHQEILITAGRHPIVEQSLSNPFTANDTTLSSNQELLIITGPNMGGKSTYLRQVALITIMAQMGSFVPAQTASLPILDRIFTRIGSADNLAAGKSTFLIEMEETATICTPATNKSLVILDDVGRGTSTNDGIALAQAIIEYLITTVRAKCLFATHYHELTHLEQSYATIKNYSMQCKSSANTLHFLHTIAPGVAHKSFGVQVARLAHIPQPIIARAEQLLAEYENQSINLHNPQNTYSVDKNPITSSPENRAHNALYQEIASLSLDTLSPKQAFDFLWKLREKIDQNDIF